VQRDAAVTSQLKADGWEVVVIWQCEASSLADAATVLRDRMNALPSRRSCKPFA
jgi:G:T-mismatch repair DNA endonuclease (very short patch repair protein)